MSAKQSQRNLLYSLHSLSAFVQRVEREFNRVCAQNQHTLSSEAFIKTGNVRTLYPRLWLAVARFPGNRIFAWSRRNCAIRSRVNLIFSSKAAINWPILIEWPERMKPSNCNVTDATVASIIQRDRPRLRFPELVICRSKHAVIN